MQLQREMIPGKPTEGMDDDNIEGCAASRCHIEQALRFRAAVVGAARTGFDEFNNGVPAARGAEGECLPPLWGHAGGGEIPEDSCRRGQGVTPIHSPGLVPAATVLFSPGFFGSYIPAPRKPETDGLSRNPNDCVKYGCIDNGG